MQGVRLRWLHPVNLACFELPTQEPERVSPIAGRVTRYRPEIRDARLEVGDDSCGVDQPVRDLARVKVVMMVGEVRVDEVAGFDAFFRAEYPRLAALGAALCGNREDGRDVAQESLARAFSAWDDVGALDRPGAWARRVVVNLARDHNRHRKVRRRRLASMASELGTRTTSAMQPFDGEFWDAVATLPDRQRTAVALFYVGDQSINEVAEVMEVSEGSVKTTLHQARTRLRRLLEQENDS